MTTVDGHIGTGFEPVAEAFRAAFDGRPGMGAGLAVLKDGEPVLSLWGGAADARTGRAWERATPSVIYSCTKGLMSLLIAKLVEEGRLDYAAPMTRYWPEFGQAGKAAVTVGEAISHRAGLAALSTGVDLDTVLDWTAMVDILAAQAPLWPLGSGYAYHAITHGWLTGELVRRVTGESPGTYFSRMIAEPLGAAAWIGLPAAQQGQVAHLDVAPDLATLWEADAARDRDAGPFWPYRSMALGQAFPAGLATPTGAFNDPRVQAAEIPGAGGIASAEALATIWAAAVTPTRGVRLLAPETVARATRVASEGPPVFSPVPPYSRWGMGFQLDSEARRYLTGASFGHDGAGGQVGFADPTHRIGFGFVTNRLEAGEDRRATAIIDALRRVLVA